MKALGISLQFGQKLTHRRRCNIGFVRDGRNLLRLAVDGTKDIVTLPPRRASHEYPFKAPEHAYDCPHHEMSSIDDEDFGNVRDVGG